MALKITLKPKERMIIGGAVITNGDKKNDFFIENKVPVLRRKDIMGVKDADSPGSRIYFIIQLMYIDEANLEKHYKTYWKLVRDFVKTAPNILGLIDRISEHILSARYYQALKLSRELTGHEQGETDYVGESTACVRYH
jgi:flagellar biosynthesis repressor protein FlbT